MTAEQEKTLEALRTAIQMEVDGKAYYLKISEQNSSEPGRQLLGALAAEEDNHRRKFETIYTAFSKSKSWPVTEFKPGKAGDLKNIFTEAANAAGKSSTVSASEIDAVQTAMTMENQTYDFYQGRSRIAAHEAEKEFYRMIAAEERGHYLALLDYYEYLQDPAAWFVKKEHPSLDGG